MFYLIRTASVSLLKRITVIKKTIVQETWNLNPTYSTSKQYDYIINHVKLKGNVRLPVLDKLRTIKRTNSSYLWFNCEYPLAFPFTGLGVVTIKTTLPHELPIDGLVLKTEPITLRSKKKSALKSFWSILASIWEIIATFLRALRLACTFVPLYILYPLTYVHEGFLCTWYKMLLFSLELSGPIFIKLGQWASTRRDLFSEEMCTCLARLQTRNKPHSWYFTNKTLERAFGPNWYTFIKLDNNGEPVGSGCCAQVYKAWIKPGGMPCEIGIQHPSIKNKEQSGTSLVVEMVEMLGIGRFMSKHLPICFKDHELCHGLKPVAMKVLHPGMATLLRRDLAIMKTGANLVTWLVPSFKWLSLPDCVDDFSVLMKAQVNLYVEAHNLERFASNFKDINVLRFPRPIWSMTKPYILVETFEQGRPMQDYIYHDDDKLKVKLADIGIHTILKMVFTDNFIHGDLHPGNMLVQEEDEMDYIKSEYPLVRFWRSISPFRPPVQLVILDCGIIISLGEREKVLLKEVFSGIAAGDGGKVARLFLNNSTHQCKDPELFTQTITDLVKFSIDKTVNLQQFAVSALMADVFTTMIKHKVKMDGCFTAVVLAVMVVEGLGRSLDPTIDLVYKARPYLFTN